jgi:hypothetical protein
LDAQRKLKRKSSRGYALKHLIEDWGGRYVSQSDVSVAAELHPDVHGKYPLFNISSKLTGPSKSRLKNIAEAGKQPNYSEDHDTENYAYSE